MVRPLRIAVFAALGAIVASASASTVAAASKEDLLREASGHERRGDYSRAVIALEQAYAASGDALIQYDIGRIYERLKRPVEAVAAFGLFLDLAPGAPELYREDASKRRRELGRGLIEIEIRCGVAGARVSLDNRALGTTPLAGRAAALPGAHHLHVEKPGFLDFDATVPEGERVVEVKLVERPAVIARIAAPAPASAAAPQTTVVATASPAPPPRERDGNSLAPKSSAVEVAAGGVFWTAKEATSSVTPGLTISAGRIVANIARWGLGVRAGGKLSVTQISTPSRATFWSLLAGGGLRRALGRRFTVYGGVDVGVLLLAGLTPDSKLLYPETVREVRSPGLLALEVRPSAGIEYALSPVWALVLGPQAVWNPRPTQFFTYQSLLRFDLSAGASLRF